MPWKTDAEDTSFTLYDFVQGGRDNFQQKGCLITKKSINLRCRDFIPIVFLPKKRTLLKKDFELCNNDVHRNSVSKRLKSRKSFKKREKIPSNLFGEKVTPLPKKP